MSGTRLGILLVIVAARVALGGAGAGPEIVVLRNGGARLEIVPDAGGRVIGFSREGSPNFISANPRWLAGEVEVPEPAFDAKWIQLDGHVVWVGPQSAWWQRNDDLPYRVVWPPDFWLEFGRFEVVERTESSIVLEGPFSPLAFVRVRKEYAVGADGTASMRYTITNPTDEDVAVDIWSNTRVVPEADVLVEYRGERSVKLDYEFNAKRPADPLQYEFVGDAVRPRHREQSAAGEIFYGKLAVETEGTRIAAFADGWVFVKEAERATPEGGSAPGHTFVEVFAQRKPDGGGYLELEFHGAYGVLRPGESREFGERWRIVRDAGASGGDAEGRARFFERDAGAVIR